jgi:hypothetical protein
MIFTCFQHAVTMTAAIAEGLLMGIGPRLEFVEEKNQATA